MAGKGIGRYTGVGLNRVDELFGPWRQDPWGRMRPCLSREAMCLSLELAAAAYDLDVEPWMTAGWTDMSIQADNRLYSGIVPAPSHSARDYLRNAWSLYQARKNLRNTNPLSQMLAALRQLDQSDTGKVLVMLRPAGEGRYVVAVGFMGTGKRFYDWFSNFRMTSDGGFHKGFLQLARQFEENEEKIYFPNTARELGLEELTLRDILQECKGANSRFDLWMAGHSQGGAVMQMWTHLKIHEDGVRPNRLMGCGFASPTVAASSALSDPAAYPLFHVINSDDLVPRVGASVHMGVGLTYPSGPMMREKCYGWLTTWEAQESRAVMRRILRRVVDAPSAIESGLAFMHLATKQPVENLDDNLAALQAKFGAVRRLLQAADRREDDLLRFVTRHAAQAYLSMTGRELDPEKVAMIQNEMEEAAEQIGFEALSRALQEWLRWPHSLVGKEGKTGPYRYIVNEGCTSLQPFIWQSGDPAMRLWLGSQAQERQNQRQEADGLWNRRLRRAPRHAPSHRHHGYLRSRR